MNLQVITKFLELRRNLHYSQKKIQKMQQKKLRKILRYAYDNSEFYKRTFEEKGINSQNIDSTPIQNFPVINKQILFENFPEILTDKKIKSQLKDTPNFAFRIPHSAFHSVHSSGSTGIPRYFLYDNSAWQTVMAGITRGCMWNISFFKLAKILFGGVRFLYIAATGGAYAGAESIGSTCKAFGAKSLFLDINEPLENWRKKIEDFKPNFVVGYPSGLKIVANLVQEGKLNFGKNVHQFVTCGEPLILGLRKNLEETFGKKIVNFYGASESLALGVEADCEVGMFLFDDLNYIEIENGRMFLTCLYNFVQPLIRYEITDRLELLEKSSEKIPFTQTKILQSRQEDIMWFEKNGKKDFIHPLSVEGICIEGLLDYQFVRCDDENFTMKIQISDSEKENAILKELNVFFEKLLNDKQMDFVKYKIEIVSEIKADSKTGKKKLIVA